MTSWFRGTKKTTGDHGNPVSVDIEEAGEETDAAAGAAAGGATTKAAEVVQRRCAPPRNPPFKVRVEKITDVKGKHMGSYKVIVFKKKKAQVMCSALAAITRIPTFYSGTPVCKMDENQQFTFIQHSFNIQNSE